jgi:hypothetical protein
MSHGCRKILSCSPPISTSWHCHRAVKELSTPLSLLQLLLPQSTGHPYHVQTNQNKYSHIPDTKWRPTNPSSARLTASLALAASQIIAEATQAASQAAAAPRNTWSNTSDPASPYPARLHPHGNFDKESSLFLATDPGGLIKMQCKCKSVVLSCGN